METYKNWTNQSENFDDAYSEKSTVPIFKNYVKKDLLLRQEIVFEELGDLQNKKLLDLGCGVGRYSHLAAMKGAKVIGIDISPKAIEIAKKKAKEFQIEDKCEFFCGDFIKYSAIPKVDYVIALGFVQYFNDGKKVIEDILKKNNKIIFDIPTFSHWINPCRKIYRTLMKGIKFTSYTENEVNKLVDYLNNKYSINLTVIRRNPTIRVISNIKD